jgi:hypothetical protein
LYGDALRLRLTIIFGSIWQEAGFLNENHEWIEDNDEEEEDEND